MPKSKPYDIHMKTYQGICPLCAHVDDWQLKNVRFGLAPTGGDYSWVQTDANVECSHCEEIFQVRVEVDLDDRKPRLLYSKFPQVKNWQYYVIAAVHRWLSGTQIIIKGFTNTLEQAESLQKNEQENSRDKLIILQIEPSGFRDLEGNFINGGENPKYVRYRLDF